MFRSLFVCFMFLVRQTIYTKPEAYINFELCDSPCQGTSAKSSKQKTFQKYVLYFIRSTASDLCHHFHNAQSVCLCRLEAMAAQVMMKHYFGCRWLGMGN